MIFKTTPRIQLISEFRILTLITTPFVSAKNGQLGTVCSSSDINLSASHHLHCLAYHIWYFESYKLWCLMTTVWFLRNDVSLMNHTLSSKTIFLSLLTLTIVLFSEMITGMKFTNDCKRLITISGDGWELFIIHAEYHPHVLNKV